MAGSSRQPDRLAYQFLLVGETKRPMKPLDRVLQELRDGVSPYEALEQHPPGIGGRPGTRVILYSAQRDAVEHAHTPQACS